MSISEIKQSADRKMQKALEACKSSLSKIRTGRAHVGVLDHIHVDYYGTSTPLNQVANVTLLDARTLERDRLGEEHGRRWSTRRSAIRTSDSIPSRRAP